MNWSKICDWDYSKSWEAIVDYDCYEKEKEPSSRTEAQRTIFIKELLQQIAWNTLNILSADVVTIYEYEADNKQFLPERTVAGRLLRKGKETEQYQPKAPDRLVKHGKSVYIENLNPHKLQSREQTREQKIFEDSNFSKRERVTSVVGVLLTQEIPTESDFVAIFLSKYRSKGGKDISYSPPPPESKYQQSLLGKSWKNSLYNLYNERLRLAKKNLLGLCSLIIGDIISFLMMRNKLLILLRLRQQLQLKN
jgi:hypothetical protein